MQKRLIEKFLHCLNPGGYLFSVKRRAFSFDEHINSHVMK